MDGRRGLLGAVRLAAVGLAAALLTGCGGAERPEPSEPKQSQPPRAERRITQPEEAGGLVRSRFVDDVYNLGEPAPGQSFLAALYRAPGVDPDDILEHTVVLATDAAPGRSEERRLHLVKEIDPVGDFAAAAKAVDPGPLGGRTDCGWTQTPEAGMVLCSWSDESTAGVIAFSGAAAADTDFTEVGRTFTAMREDIVR
ncbi:hypothetical protein [Actinocorallia populi]|uniref:hypothetical protein n=1 Tax=Actinocorallia populi TaxID=2079200 RepID=UPI000D091D2E|nr:hypothetical protein [Actinocorallia populi]